MYVMDGYDALTPEDLVSSTAPGDTVAVWNAGTTYVKGQLVYGADGITVYEAAVGPATYLAGSYCGQKFGEGLPNLNYNPEEMCIRDSLKRSLQGGINNAKQWIAELQARPQSDPFPVIKEVRVVEKAAKASAPADVDEAGIRRAKANIELLQEGCLLYTSRCV